jgi:hypothetical protein
MRIRVNGMEQAFDSHRVENAASPYIGTITISATTAGIFRRLQVSRACKWQAASRVLGMK